MNITNVYNLPAAIVRAVESDPYVGGGDISCTKLIDAPQIRTLLAEHKDRVVVDVSERVWALLGQAVHTILERAGLREQGMVIEERLYAKMLGWDVSAQFDRMQVDEGIITDYKVTTVFKQHGADSWTRQLNVLRWLAHQHGHEITALNIVAIFRDFRKSESERNPSYPRAAIVTIPVPLWSIEEAERYVEERVALHQWAQSGHPVQCTDEERWYSGTTFALMKHGGKRAVKVASDRAQLPTYDEATHAVVERPGVYKRCLHYCDVRHVCSQWAAESGTAVTVDEEGE